MAAAVAWAPGRVFQSTLPLTTVDDIPKVMKDLQNTHGVQALYVCTDPLITSSADILNEWAAVYNLPTMHAFSINRGSINRGQVNALYWGPKLEVLFGQAADLVYTWQTTAARPLWQKADPAQFGHYPLP